MAAERTLRNSYQGLGAGFAFIAVAIAILIAWASNQWLNIVPILLIEFGLFGLIVGSTIGRKSEDDGGFASESAYLLLWGSLLTILGISWFVGTNFPESAPVLIAILLIFIGVFILWLSWKRSSTASKKT